MKTNLGKGVKDTKDFLAFGDPDALIFFMSLGGIFWGLWLVAPWDVFEATTSFYALKSTLLSETMWGILFMVVHTFKFIIWNHFRALNKVSYYQVWSNFSMFVLWSLVATNIWMSNWQSSATPVYTFFALAAIWATSQRWAQVKRQNRIALLQELEDAEAQDYINELEETLDNLAKGE